MEKLKKDLFQIRYAIILLLIYCVFTQAFFGLICPFKIITHIDCPACGLTRATIALFTGHLKKALDYNPTVLYWDLSIILFLFDRYVYNIKIKPFPYMFIVSGVVTLIWYFISMYFEYMYLFL